MIKQWLCICNYWVQEISLISTFFAPCKDNILIYITATCLTPTLSVSLCKGLIVDPRWKVSPHRVSVWRVLYPHFNQLFSCNNLISSNCHFVVFCPHYACKWTCLQHTPVHTWNTFNEGRQQRVGLLSSNGSYSHTEKGSGQRIHG